MSSSPRTPDFHTLRTGDRVSFEALLDRDKVLTFARITGDHNPLHVDADHGRASEFGGNIVHGALANALFSTVVGMYLPGRDALYLSQNSQFLRPIPVGSSVTVHAEVVQISEPLRLVTLSTEIRLPNGEVAVKGEAKALFRPQASKER